MTGNQQTAEEVRKWLEKSGLPLEMHAAAAFRRAGFFVRQASAYSDEQGEKSREIDVLASIIDPIGTFEISFVVECKASPKPWVVLRSEDAFSGYDRLAAFGIGNRIAYSALSQLLAANVSWGTLRQYIDLPEEGGYGFRQAFGGENDAAYGAAMSVLKACRGVTAMREVPNIGFAFPVIVVDAPLFECALSPSGEETQVTQVESSRFIFSAYMPDWTGCCISVVRRSQLESFARQAKSMSEAILTELKPFGRNILEEWRSWPGRAVTEREDADQ